MDYTVSQNRKGSWYAHPVGKKDEPVEGSVSTFRLSALQSAADCMGMSYGEYMAYREKHLEAWKEKPYNPATDQKKKKNESRSESGKA